jgi:hypothetical protein
LVLDSQKKRKKGRFYVNPPPHSGFYNVFGSSGYRVRAITVSKNNMVHYSNAFLPTTTTKMLPTDSEDFTVAFSDPVREKSSSAGGTAACWTCDKNLDRQADSSAWPRNSLTCTHD